MPGRTNLGLLQQVVDGISDGVIVVDHSGRTVLVNEPARRLISGGTDMSGGPADWVDRHGLFHPGSGARFRPEELPISRALHGETVNDVEMITRPPAGHERILSINARPVVLSPAEPPGALTAFQDVTARRRAETVVLEHMAAVQRHADLPDVVHDAVLVRDTDSRIVYANPEAEELYGWPLAEMIGRVTHDLLDTRFPESRAAIDDALLHTGHWAGELNHARRDDSRITVRSRQALQRDADGRPAAIIEINSDVTARTLAEQRSRAAQEQLVQLNAELEDRVRDRTLELERRTIALQSSNAELEAFSYSVSHDLRAPLRAMNGFTRILLDDYAGALPGPAVRYLHKVRENADQMGQLVDALLAFSRMQRQEMRHEELDMAALARRAANDAAGSTPTGYVEIGDLPPCEGDPQLIRQVWANLLDNAVKYSQRSVRPEVVVSGALVDDDVVYSVRDNGVGFDPRYSDKLFKVFQRLHRPDEFEGTGIGLALVERIVSRHGGRVWADGTPGVGATFSFSLPRYQVS